MGVASGCGFKEIYRFPIPTPLVSVLFCSSIPTFLFIKKNFFSFFIIIYIGGSTLLSLFIGRGSRMAMQSIQPRPKIHELIKKIRTVFWTRFEIWPFANLDQKNRDVFFFSLHLRERY